MGGRLCCCCERPPRRRLKTHRAGPHRHRARQRCGVVGAQVLCPGGAALRVAEFGALRVMSIGGVDTGLGLGVTIFACIELRADVGQRVGELPRMLGGVFAHGEDGLSSCAPTVLVIIFPPTPERAACVFRDESSV